MSQQRSISVKAAVFQVAANESAEQTGETESGVDRNNKEWRNTESSGFAAV